MPVFTALRVYFIRSIYLSVMYSVTIKKVEEFACYQEGQSLTCKCRYADQEDTAKAKKGFHDLEASVSNDYGDSCW